MMNKGNVKIFKMTIVAALYVLLLAVVIPWTVRADTEEDHYFDPDTDVDWDKAEKAEEIVIGTDYTVEIESSHDYILYKLKPAQNGFYEVITSNPSGDPCVSLYDVEFQRMENVEYNSFNHGCYIYYDKSYYGDYYELEKGQTYYVIAGSNDEELCIYDLIIRKLASVRFSAGNGSFSENGDSLTLLASEGRRIEFWSFDTPKRKGYEFMGWSSDPDAKVRDETLLVKNGCVFYAVWTSLTHYSLVTFDAGPGSIYEPSDGKWHQSVLRDYNTILWDSVNTYEDYLFEKEKDPNCTYDNYEMLVKYDGDHYLSGWTDENGDGPLSVWDVDDKIKKGQSEITLYAIWEPYVQVVLDGNGEKCFLRNGKATDSVLYKARRGHTLQDLPSGIVQEELPDSHKKFRGWSDQPDGRILRTAYPFTKDVTLYARWKEGCTLIFDANGGWIGDWGEKKNGLTKQSIVCEPGIKIKELLPDELYMQHDSLDFQGWSRNKKATKADTDLEKAEVKENDTVITYYAVWGKNNPELHLVFNGGVQYLDDEPITEDTYFLDLGDHFFDGTEQEEIIREGYKLIGWSFTKNGPAIRNVESLIASECKEYTFYAVWEKVSGNNDKNKQTQKGEAVTEDQIDTMISSSLSEEGPKGSEYGKLQARIKSAKKHSISIQWNKIPGATKYIVYGNKCGKHRKLVRLGSTLKLSYKQKGLKKNTYYKYLVVAAKSQGSHLRVLSISKVVHITTLPKYNNFKKINVKKSKITLYKGKKRKNRFKLKAKAVKKGKKTAVHRKLCYESSAPKIATVSKKGVIKAVAKGKCRIYIYAQDGTRKIVKVTVK